MVERGEMATQICGWIRICGLGGRTGSRVGICGSATRGGVTGRFFFLTGASFSSSYPSYCKLKIFLRCLNIRSLGIRFEPAVRIATVEARSPTRLYRRANTTCTHTHTHTHILSTPCPHHLIPTVTPP